MTISFFGTFVVLSPKKLLQKMKIIVENGKLYLREFELEDAEQMFLLNSDPEVLRYTGDGPFDSTEEAKTFLENYNSYQLHSMGRWAAIRKDDKKFLGWCGLKKHPDGLTDIGFRFFRAEWGKGYATLSAQLALTYGFEKLKLPHIILRCHPQNKASIRIAKKLGMSFWKQESVQGLGHSLWYRIYPLEG